MMNSHLIVPVEGHIIFGKCIDADNAKTHEDLIRVTKELNGSTQIDIAVIKPPIKNVSFDELLISLRDLITNETRELFLFMDTPSRARYGFNAIYPRSALVATYTLDSKGELIFEELVISEAIGEMITYSEYCQSSEYVEILSSLRKVLKTKPNVEKHVNKELARALPKSKNAGYETTFILTQLFNATCREAARRKNVRIPFIRRPNLERGDNFFLINNGFAKFNAPLRDPCGFINICNLISYFSGEKIPPFTKKFLRKILPIRSLYGQF